MHMDCKERHIACSASIMVRRDNVVSDVTHILGGCPSEKFRKIHCLRHDQTVERIFESITRGNKGAAKVLHDSYW